MANVGTKWADRIVDGRGACAEYCALHDHATHEDVEPTIYGLPAAVWLDHVRTESPNAWSSWSGGCTVEPELLFVQVRYCEACRAVSREWLENFHSASVKDR